jgi:hypothetical protein
MPDRRKWPLDRPESQSPQRIRRWLLAAVIGSAGIATNAFSAGSDIGLLDKDANTGFYTALSLGQSDEKINAGAFVQSPALYVNSSSLGIQAAVGYRPLPAWSAEADYVRLGRASSGASYANIDGIMVSALGYLPTPLINLYARIGLLDARTYGFYDGTPAHGSAAFHHRNANLAFGLGLITNFRGNLNFRLESQGFQVTHAQTSSLFSIGIVWTFF